MKSHRLVTLAPLAALSLWSAAGYADREPGWDFGADVIYQDSQDITFTGGSTASLDDDVGIALSFGYRINSRFEVTFGLDWNTVDYEVNVVPDPGFGGLAITGNGDLESFTPRVGANFNILEGDLTPYVSGNIGWAFIDTNIPDSRAQTACWWDPWFGYYCGTWQSTRSIDEFAYGLGVGVRWDVGDAISLRLGYEKHWLDLGEATSTPDFDQLKLGISARY